MNRMNRMVTRMKGPGRPRIPSGPHPVHHPVHPVHPVQMQSPSQLQLPAPAPFSPFPARTGSFRNMTDPADVARAYDRWAASYDADRNATRDLDAEVLRRAPLGVDGRDVLE